MVKRPSEADLGLEPTAEEMDTQAPSRVAPPEDDYPEGGDQNPVDPDNPEGLPPELNEDKADRARDADGKFVKQQGQPEGKRQPPPKGYVEQQALHAERAERKAAEDRARILEERMNLFLEAQLKPKQPEPEKPAIPDMNTDPLAFIQHVNERLTGFENESKAQREQREAVEREEAEFSQGLNVARPAFEEAAAADPGLNDQYNGLLASYAREIAHVNGIPTDGTATPQQRAFVGAELTKLERGHIQFAVKSGRNVVDYFRGIAESRGIVAGQGGVATVNDAARAPQVQPRTIAQRQQSQQRHMSLGDAPGGSAPAKTTARDVANMTPEQFKAFARQMGEAGMDELMGKG